MTVLRIRIFHYWERILICPSVRHLITSDNTICWYLQPSKNPPQTRFTSKFLQERSTKEPDSFRHSLFTIPLPILFHSSSFLLINGSGRLSLTVCNSSESKFTRFFYAYVQIVENKVLHDQQWLTSSKKTWVFRKICLSSVSSRKLRLSASAFWFTSLSSFSSFSKVASRSIISRGCGASGFSPVSNIGMPSFLISFSR